MKFLITSIILLFSLQLKASHVAGGYISYTPTGNLNEYTLTLTIYRDCSGINVPVSTTLDISNTCGFNDTTATLGFLSSEEISQICPSQLANTTCNSGLLQGFEKHVFQGVFTLPDTCSNWTFSYSSCDRNSSINLSVTACFYVENVLNSADFPYNSSSTITHLFEMPYVCNNLPVNFSSYVADLIADSLHFSLVNTLSATNTNISYVAPYTATQPIPGIAIAPLTGQIEFTPTMVGNYVVTVLIEEFDESGNFIGSVIHDYQFIVESCTNAPPTAANTITNFNDFGTSASIGTNDIINLCDGDQFCFDYVFTDADLGDSLILSTDILSNFPGATFIQTGFNPSTASICWTVQPNYTSSFFSIHATDENCPLSGMASKIFLLNLPPLFSLPTDSILNCLGSLPSNLNLNTNLNVYWTDLNNDTLVIGTDISCNPCTNPNFLFSATTQVIAKTGNNCGFSDTLTVLIGQPVAVDFADDSSYICIGDSITFTAPFSQATNLWNNDTIPQNSITVGPTVPTYYYLESTYFGCSAFDTTVVLNYPLFIPTIQIGQGGLYTGNYNSYQWSVNNQTILGGTNQNVIPSINGNYTVEVTDSNGCSGISFPFSVTTASINEESHKTSIHKTGQTIVIKTEEIDAEIYVYDLSGRLVTTKAQTGQTTKISIKNVTQIHLVKVIDSNGKMISAKKL